MAPFVVAGNGLQFDGPTLRKRPPPVPEPTHWLTVAAVTGRAPDVSALMFFVIATVHVIGCAASLLKPLHWSTVMVAAVAGEGISAIPAKENALVIMAQTIIDERRVSRLLQLSVFAVFLGKGPQPSDEGGQARLGRRAPRHAGFMEKISKLRISDAPSPCQKEATFLMSISLRIKHGITAHFWAGFW